jgi:hypothetical protein
MSTPRHVIAIVAIAVCLPSTGRAAEVAVISVEANRPLAVGEMKSSALLHSNRDYSFGAFPDELKGFQYTLHRHKGPSRMALKVTSGGDLYLCLVEGGTPARLKLGSGWQSVGRMEAIAAGRPYGGEVFKTSVARGQALVVPPGNKWGAIVLARKIEGLDEHDGPSPAPPVQAGEFGELQRQFTASAKWNRARLEEEVFRKPSLILDSDRTPVDIVLRRTRALLDDLRTMEKAPALDEEAAELEKLHARNAPDLAAGDQVKLFETVVALRRRIAFKNPLLNFGKIVFLKHHRSTFQHMCDQYYGHFARQGGGVFVLESPFGANPAAHDLLENAVVANGRTEGRKLEGGSFISLELDYDAKTLYFAWTQGSKAKWTPDGTFHVFKYDLDSNALTQLTDGPWNDFDPCVLPNGRLAFVSERIGGFLRCGRYCPTYTVHGMMPDGSDIIHLSYHETHEWHPSVDNDGMIVYTRWDYVDRDSDIAHHIWHCFPDGRNPRSYHGNYPERRESRPWMEMSIRAIPGSHRYISVAAPHHGQAYGSLVQIDVREHDDRSMSQLKRVTPEIHLPESETAPGVSKVSKGAVRKSEVCGSPWPLSEDYYLCVYDGKAANYGIYLLDSFGNRELLYRDAAIPCLDPIPLRPRRRPPVIPVATTQAKADRPKEADPAMGVVTVMNVYESDMPWPEGTRITDLRIVNLFSKATPAPDVPRIGHADQSLARGVLGTVPVEADGSAHFKVPAGMSFYMQALDEKGMCVQNMRSATFVHPGETLGCIGCHEPKHQPPRYGGEKVPIAMQSEPSAIEPEGEGTYPLTFARLVQPVLDARCVACHDKEAKAPGLRGDRFGKYGWSESMHALHRLAWGKHGGNGALHSRNKRSYSIPGQEGARVSKLYAHLNGGHKKVKLRADEMRRITLWLDCNSCFYGAYSEIEKQAAGEVVRPRLALPPWVDFKDLVR